MPVAQGGLAPARQALVIGAAALLGVLAVVFLVTRLDNLTGEEDETVSIGGSLFPVAQADELAEAIAAQGPLLLQDAASGDLDVWVHHLGDDPDRGWVAFAARESDAPRECFANWNPDDRTFVDTCTDEEFPENGEGLQQFGVSVDPEGTLTINLSGVG